MSVTLISVNQDTVVSNKHEERTRHYYVIFQHQEPDPFDDADPKKLRPFVVQCEINFQANPKSFQKDRAKVTFAQSYLKGIMLEYFEPDLLGEQPPALHPLWMDHWSIFYMSYKLTLVPTTP